MPRFSVTRAERAQRGRFVTLSSIGEELPVLNELEVQRALRNQIQMMQAVFLVQVPLVVYREILAE